jgi:hypothetical protein
MTLARLTPGRSDKANSACHAARTVSLSCDEQEVVSLPHSHYTSEEIVQHGQALDTIKVYDGPSPKDNSARGRGAYAKV